MSSYTLSFCRYLLGLRSARTSDTPAELALLQRLAAPCHLVIEVGVFEGVASALMAAQMPAESRLVLVDPYFPSVKLERLLRFSMAQTIAHRQLSPHRNKVTWVREISARAAEQVRPLGLADLIFIDARHEYEYVAEDFRTWSPLLAPGGKLAFHDSLPCPTRPDLYAEVGSVKFARELQQGQHGPWTLTDHADSLSVFTLLNT